MFDVPVFDLGFHDYSRGALVLLAISAFLAALARGFSGFGSALIFVPLASTAIGPHAAAPLLLIIDGIAAAGLIPNAWRHADKRDVGTMSIGALVGVPLGAWILTRSDPLTIRWSIALFGVLLLATVFVNPHLFLYDATVLVLPVLWIGGWLEQTNWPFGRAWWQAVYGLSVMLLLPTAPLIGVQISVVFLGWLLVRSAQEVCAADRLAYSR